MFSLLNYNDLKLENFQPKSGKIDENLNREGFGVQRLPGGIIIEGLWKKNKLSGEAKITFEDCVTNISGLFENNMIQKGIIEYESGAMAAGSFQNNEIYDYFKDIKFNFASGFVFLGIYDQNCNLIQGTLSGSNGQILLNWQGQTMIHMIDNSNQGIIIENSRLYEGQILKGKRYGQGAEYYPLGLIYNIYTQSGQDGFSKEIDFCYLNKTQYRSVSNFQNQQYLSKQKNYPNGIVETFDIKISQRTRITFEKLQMEGYIETFDIEESYKRPTKGIFYYKNVILNVLFQHSELNFNVFYKKKEFSLEQWYSSVDPDYKNTISTRTIEFSKEKVKKTKVKKKNSLKSTKDKSYLSSKEKSYLSTKDKSYLSTKEKIIKDRNSLKEKNTNKTKEKSHKHIIETKCDPKKSLNCSQIRDMYSLQQKKLDNMKKENKTIQTQMISLQNLNTILLNQVSQKNDEVEKLKKEIEELKLKSVQNLDQYFFRGNLINGLKQGWVEEQLEKEYYQGFYKDNIREGKGYLVTNKFEYKGEFKGGTFEGKGEKLYFENQKNLKGKFMNGNFIENKIYFPNYYYEGQVFFFKMKQQRINHLIYYTLKGNNIKVVLNSLMILK